MAGEEEMTIRQTPSGQLLVWLPDETELRDSYRRFHRGNPDVYLTLVSLAHRWKERHPGRKCGIGMLYEVARWTIEMRTTGEPLKLNNNYRAFYAREIMEREFDLEGIFDIRRQRSED
jgi:hypothetical protein